MCIGRSFGVKSEGCIVGFVNLCIPFLCLYHCPLHPNIFSFPINGGIDGEEGVDVTREVAQRGCHAAQESALCRVLVAFCVGL